MKRTPTSAQAIPSSESQLLTLSSTQYNWENLVVEQCHHPASGQYKALNSDEHIVYLGLVARPITLTRIRGERVNQGIWKKGDIAIAPASDSLSDHWKWEGEDKYVEMRLATTFVEKVALEALNLDSNRVDLDDKFRERDPQLEQIGMMLLSELQNGGIAGKLYVESLTNVLAIHLLRNYTTTQPTLILPGDGLPSYQMKQIMEFIDSSLDQEIKLSDLAELSGMSQFHFSRCFKQTLNMSPHQYIIQQRVERAKQLLNSKDLTLSEIALQCGFSSQSHLGEWFRKTVGVTPKAYRKMQ